MIFHSVPVDRTIVRHFEQPVCIAKIWTTGKYFSSAKSDCMALQLQGIGGLVAIDAAKLQSIRLDAESLLFAALRGGREGVLRRGRELERWTAQIARQAEREMQRGRTRD